MPTQKLVIQMFIEALYIVTRMWKQSKYPSTDEWEKISLYNAILFSHEKEWNTKWKKSITKDYMSYHYMSIKCLE